MESQSLFVIKYNASGISKVGIPDVLVCINSRFIGLEVKTEEGVLSEIQKIQINHINNCGGASIVLRPSHFNDFKKYLENFIQTNNYDEFKDSLLKEGWQ